MKSYYSSDAAAILHGDCRAVLPELAELGQVDSVITDPPYELAFMGKGWDRSGISFDPETWRLVLAAAKPGATLLCFGGTRTWHRIACAIEDAGWAIRDTICWLYGQGFPKSLDIGKTAGPEWSGWGTGLKPAFEPIIVAMKPLVGTFAENALAEGVAGLNIDGCRIPGAPESTRFNPAKHNHDGWRMNQTGAEAAARATSTGGRFPANVILDEEAAALLDEQTGELKSGFMAASTHRSTDGGYHGDFPKDRVGERDTYGDSGGASRFFYCAKASRTERGESNDHPTVKPLNLLRYLCRLTNTPSGGVVLDPFMGSGTTLLAAQMEGRASIGIELEEHNCEIAVRRLESARTA